MSATLPNKFNRPESRDVTSGEEIIAADWDEMVQGTHYLWSRQITHFGGAQFDPPFSTTSTDITTHGTPTSNDMRPLDTVSMWGFADRVDENLDVVIFVQATLKNMTVRFNIYRGISTSPSAQADLSNTSGGVARVGQAGTIRVSSGGDLIRVEVNAKAEDEDNELHQVGAWEAVVTSSSDLPASP